MFPAVRTSKCLLPKRDSIIIEIQYIGHLTTLTREEEQSLPKYIIDTADHDFLLNINQILG